METERLLSQAFLESHPREAAPRLERLPPDEAAALLQEVAPAVAGAALQRMGLPNGAACLSRLSPEKAAAIIAALPLDSAARLMRWRSAEDRAGLLILMADETRTLLQRLLRFPEGTAGALMDARALALPEDITASEALTRVRRSLRHIRHYIYVVDREQRLVGVLNLRELMLAPRRFQLSRVMRRPVAWLPAHADPAAIVAHPGWREFHALPVVDDSTAFLGAVRYETFRQLESEHSGNRAPAAALAALLSFGELCWIGMTGLLTGLAARRISSKQEGSHD